MGICWGYDRYMMGIEDIFEDIMGAQCGYDGNFAIKAGDIM